MSSTAPQRRTRFAPPISTAALGRARLAVVPRLRSRAPRVPFVMLVSLILLGGVVGLLLFNTSMQQASFTAAQLEDEADVLAAREQALGTELEELRSPGRIADQACKLGMVVGPPAAFLDLGTGAVSGTPVAAGPGPAAPCAVPPPAPAPKPETQQTTQQTQQTNQQAQGRQDATRQRDGRQGRQGRGNR